MAYGTVKVDTIIFDNGGADQSVTASGIYKAITSGVTVTGTISGVFLIGTTTVSGATVTGTSVRGVTVQGASGTFTSLTGTTTTGTTANFASGVFTTVVSGATITGTTAQFTSGTFVSLTGTAITGTTINGTTISSATGTFTSITGTAIAGTTVTFTSGIIASGTVAAPSLSILADPNTGIYSPAADTLAFVEGGVEVIRITQDSKVGIGTTSPGELVELSATTDPKLQFTDVGNVISKIGISASTALTFEHNGSERVRIDASGQVGIGTSSPTTLLDVNADTIRVRTARTPASASASGGGGEICWDSNYIYVCTATNTWKRTAIATW